MSDDPYKEDHRWFLLSRLSSGAVMIAHPSGRCLTLTRQEYEDLVARVEKAALRRLVAVARPTPP